MGITFRIHERDDRHKILVRNLQGSRHRYKLEDVIKIDLREIMYGKIKWIQLV
jgi:hypothetical protein